MAAKYRAAIIGHTGQGNYGHGLDVVYADMPEVEVVAVADPDPEGLAAASERIGAARSYTDFREMLVQEEVDLVNVCPRVVTLHAEMAETAAVLQRATRVASWASVLLLVRARVRVRARARARARA